MSQDKLWIAAGVGCAVLGSCGLCVTSALVYTLVLRPEAEPPPAPLTAPGSSGPTSGASGSGPPPMVGPATPLAPSGGSDPRTVRATVTESSGFADVPVGAPCVAQVTRYDLEDGTFWCNAQITCGSRRVYGGGQAGFFNNCVLFEQPRRDVVGSDSATSSNDGDPAMTLDTRRGVLEVSDETGRSGERMRIVARVDGVE